MESTPLITIAATTTSPADEERYRKWIDEVYSPLTLKYNLSSGMDVYTLVKENAEYPQRISLICHSAFGEWNNYISSPVWADIRKDAYTTFKREVIWMGVYQLTRSFHGVLSLRDEKQTTFVDDAPVMHLLGLKLSVEKEEFNAWFKEWGAKVYVPIMMKLPGLKAANFYTFTGRSSQPEIKDPGYPDFLSLWYFDTLAAFHNFEESPELMAFMKSLKSDFPGGVSLKWNVQYELYKSFRK
jgi:hypothetical protein